MLRLISGVSTSRIPVAKGKGKKDWQLQRGRRIGVGQRAANSVYLFCNGQRAQCSEHRAACGVQKARTLS